MRPPFLALSERARLGLPTVLILIIFPLAGCYFEGLLVGLGTYPVLFGAIPDREHRAKVMAAVGVGLILAMSVGILVTGNLWWTLGAFLVVAVAGVALDQALPLGPPGPYFFLLMVGGGTVVGQAGWTVMQSAGWLILGAVIAFLVAVAGRDKGTGPPPGRPVDWLMFWRVSIGAVVVYAALDLTGDPHPFWGLLATVLVLCFLGDGLVLGVRAFHRVFGTVLGFLGYWLWTLIHPPQEVDFIAMGVLLWIVMAITSRNYGYGVFFITMLALLMTQALAPDAPPLDLAAGRVITTTAGAGIAVILVALLRPSSPRPDEPRRRGFGAIWW
ncbi:FUSC family protein [Corynebacterium suedekumii]|uniref:FUSC family protein n=1 Tax=Corynebacterium suedekumii TaxID=3049801 RepID=A0ABY8VIN3_9CORY|nr:FUSC family protein [Corynebacterium suedekumii]WIM69373.1 FUSC family protein [Corynebacterium suedekumii]